MHRAESHFQDARTYARWVDHLIEIVKRRRIELGKPNARALLVIEHGIDVIFVPPKMTHVFQPAYQYIIANVKKHAQKAYYKWISDVYSDHEVAEANKLVIVRSLPEKRKQKFKFLASAINELSEEAILKSWHVTGIPRALKVPLLEGAFVSYDNYQQDEPAAEHLEEDEVGDDDAPEEELAVVPVLPPRDYRNRQNPVGGVIELFGTAGTPEPRAANIAKQRYVVGKSDAPPGGPVNSFLVLQKSIQEGPTSPGKRISQNGTLENLAWKKAARRG
jgi:hypothetical protein